MKIVFATHNLGKLKEVREILTGLEVQILSAEEAGVFEDVVEDGKTFEENALKKARFVAEKTKKYAMADDTGLCIKALGCFPGVHSARWAGEGVAGEEIAQRVLDKAKNISKDSREAYFETIVALVSPEGREWVFQGRIDGFITEELRGKSHPKLPYDSIFIPKGYDETFAEMSAEEKNKISHRGIAFRRLREFLGQTIDKN